MKEPDLNILNQAVKIGRKNDCDFVIGFGGGAPIDVGKAVSALLNNSGKPLDYLEGVKKFKLLELEVIMNFMVYTPIKRLEKL